MGLILTLEESVRCVYSLYSFAQNFCMNHEVDYWRPQENSKDEHTQAEVNLQPMFLTID